MNPPFQRIVHVMRRFVPAKWGGTESVVFHLAREYSRLGIESPIYTTAMFSQPGKEIFRGVEIHRFRYSLPWWGLDADGRQALELKGGNPLSISMLRALMHDHRTSLFHTHVQHRLGGTARFAARHLNIPYVVSIHGGHHTLPGEQTARMLAPTRGRIEWGRLAGMALGARRTLDDAGAIFCVGQDEYDAMRIERPNQPVHYQPNGVDLPRFRDAKRTDFFAKFPRLSGKKLILCVSRVDPQKNQLLLVRAFAAIADTLTEHHLVLIGAEVDEDYGRRLRAEISAIPDRVTWIPGLPPDDPALPGAFQASEMFALSSCHEPFGIVILEAWAASLPVVATRVGGIPGFTTPEENILLVENGDGSAMSAAMLRVAKEPGLARHLGENGARLAAERYDWPAIAKNLLSLYPQPKTR